ncbi:MAG: Ig-like domain repeat protein, partial [Gemmatimonadota bacterium]|nr:Ig-like domain repeat protein [Gemmatimonadota bacterium]
VGDYRDTILIAPTDGSTDPVRVPVHFSIQPCREQSYSVGTTVTDSLTTSDCESPHRAGRSAKLFLLSALAGDSVSVLLQSTTFTPYVLVDSVPAGSVPALAESDRCPAGTAGACIRYVLLPRAGTYYVEVTSGAGASSTGAFTLELQSPRAPGSPGTPAQFEIDSITPVAIGGTLGDPAFVVKANTSDPDIADSVALEVEIQPIGTAFGDTATAKGGLYPAGTAASVLVGGLADNTSFHWQVRSVDQTGRNSAWLPFGGNAEDGADVRVAISQRPNVPTSLGQFRSDGTTPIDTGAVTGEPTVVFRGTVSDPDPGDPVRLEVEVQPFGTPFSDVATAAGVLVPNGTIASVTVTGLADGTPYHWQVRTVDQATQASAWVPFAGAGQTTEDFRVVFAPTDLVFVAQPTSVTAGSVISPVVSVQVRKASGIVDTTYGGIVDVVIAPGTGTAGAMLGGAVSVAANRGVATFSNLSVDRAGTGYRLLASATGLNPATSAPFDVAASSAAKLALATLPSPSGQSGIPLGTQPVVQLQDPSGNAVGQAGVQVIATIASGRAGAVLSGDTAVTDASGRAVYDTLAITGLTGSYTLRFAASGLTEVLSGTINLTTGVADPSRTTASVPAGVAGTVTNILVTVRDGGGNQLPVGGETVIVSVTGANSASPTVTDNGDGTYVAIYTPAAAGTDSVRITLNAAAISGSPYLSSVTAGGAARLVLLASPTAAVAGSDFSPAVRVAVQDANGNTVTSSTAAVTMAIGANPGGGTLSGTATVNAVSGIATFANLSINRVGTGYTLTAAATGLAGATSPAFDVTPGAAAKLAFTGQPTDVIAGSNMLPAVVVTVQDASGNTATSFNDSVTVGIATNPGLGTLGGTLRVAAVNGVATFSTLTIDKTGIGYTLSATSAPLTPATSTGFTVTPASPVALVFTRSPPSSVVASGTIAPPVLVAVKDAYGNTVTGSTASITVGIGTNPAGGVLSGTTMGNAVAGVATFSTLSIDKEGTGYTLTATSAPLTGATSTPFDIEQGSGNRLAFVVQPSDAEAGAPNAPPIQVAVQDAGGNTVAGATDRVTLVFADNPGGATLTGTTAVDAVAGIATFSDVRVDRVGVGYTLTALGSGLVSATSTAFDIAPATTTTSVASSTNPSVFGQNVTFTATVTGGPGTPTGNVQFKVDGANLGAAVALDGSGQATSPPTSGLAAGTHVITAEYTGATNFAASTGTLP